MTMFTDTRPGPDDVRHEAIVCVRLKTTIAGSHLLDHLRAQPFVVSAWWIAADIDAVVLLSAPSMRELHRAIGDLRLLAAHRRRRPTWCYARWAWPPRVDHFALTTRQRPRVRRKRPRMLADMDIRMITEHGTEKRPVGELADLLADPAGFVWVDIGCCDDEAVRVLSEVFGFHPLAVKDCVERNRVPKMHAYPAYVFVVSHAPERGERGHVHYLELDQFIGANFLVTVHGPTNPAVSARAALRETRSVLERIENGRLRPDSPFALSHAIVNALTRNQEEYVEQATAEVWRLEQQVTGGTVDDPEAFSTSSSARVTGCRRCAR